MDSNKIGAIGEKIAANYILNKGFKILMLNYRNKFGEIDIIANDDKYIVFIEVKTRKENSISLPAEAVNKKKQQRIIKCAVFYLAQNNSTLQPRFDVIEVITKKTAFKVKSINHIPNAFFQEEDYAVF